MHNYDLMIVGNDYWYMLISKAKEWDREQGCITILKLNCHVFIIQRDIDKKENDC